MTEGMSEPPIFVSIGRLHINTRVRSVATGDLKFYERFGAQIIACVSQEI